MILPAILPDINENTLRPHFKEAFETIFRCPMDALSKSPAWYFEEINIYFKALKGRERRLLNSISSLHWKRCCRFTLIPWNGGISSPEIRGHSAIRRKESDSGRITEIGIDQMVPIDLNRQQSDISKNPVDSRTGGAQTGKKFRPLKGMKPDNFKNKFRCQNHIAQTNPLPHRMHIPHAGSQNTGHDSF